VYVVYDTSEDTWDFQANDITTTGDISGGGLSVGGVTNYTTIDGSGNIQSHGSAAFMPRKVFQSAQPSPGINELMLWRDTDDGKLYLMYNDYGGAGVKKVELT